MVALGLVLAPAVAFGQQQQTPPAAAAAPAPSYRLAFSGRVAVGLSGWGTEVSALSEIGARVHVLPWLGVGLSYLRLTAANNEASDPFTFDALAVSAAWHPVVGKWFDPFVQASALAAVDAGGGYQGRQTTSRFGLEGMAGLDLVRLPVAGGLHARSGFTNSAWTMVGLHIELRF